MTIESRKEITHAELIALQAIVCEDIGFFKNQQWQSAYYGLLLFAAIVAIPKLLDVEIDVWQFFGLWLVACLVLAKGIYVLNELQEALTHRRDILPFLRRHFTSEALLAYGAGDADRAFRPSNEKVSLTSLFMSAYVLAFILVTWILFVWGTNA